MTTAAQESPKTLTAVRDMSRRRSTAKSARMALSAPGMPELFMMMRMATIDAEGTPATPMLVSRAEMTTSICAAKAISSPMTWATKMTAIHS